MRKDCLVTKLKATVNNSSLEKLGVLTLHTTDTPMTVGTDYIMLRFTENSTVYSPDGTIKNTSGDTLSNPLNIIANIGTNFVLDANSTLEIDNKYKLSIIYIYHSNLVEKVDTLCLKPLTELTQIAMQLKGDLSNLENLFLLTQLNAKQNSANNDLTGAIESLANLTSLTSIDLFRNSAITGSIANLGKLKSLINLSIGDTKISGSIESFVVAQRAANGSIAGRTTCNEITMSYLPAGVTFNGSRAASINNAKLSWTADTITFNGVTITA